MKFLNIVCIGCVLSMCLTGCASTAPSTYVLETSDEDVITVSSSHKLKVEPDIAEIVYSVSNEAEEADVCQLENAEKVDAVLKVLKGLGVEDSQVQTSGYGLSPQYTWEDNSNKRILTGYEMSTEITLTDLSFDKLGEVISESIKAGVNNISYVDYKCSTYDDSYNKALELALQKAYEKASVLASASGETIDSVYKLTESGSMYEASYRNYAVTGKGMVAEEKMDTALNVVSPGEIDITANITVSYKLK